MSIQISPIGRLPQTTRRDFLTRGALVTLGLATEKLPGSQALGQTINQAPILDPAKVALTTTELSHVYLPSIKTEVLDKKPNAVLINLTWFKGGIAKLLCEQVVKNREEVLSKGVPRNEFLESQYIHHLKMCEALIYQEHTTLFRATAEKSIYHTFVEENLFQNLADATVAVFIEYAYIILLSKEIEEAVKKLQSNEKHHVDVTKIRLAAHKMAKEVLEKLQKDISEKGDDTFAKSILKARSLSPNSWDNLKEQIDKMDKVIKVLEILSTQPKTNIGSIFTVEQPRGNNKYPTIQGNLI